MHDGADLLDVGGVKAGPGPEVGEAEELDRVVPAIEALARAFRRAAVGRHVARLRARRGVRGGRGRRATTSPGSAIPTTSRSPPSTRRPSSRRTSACVPRVPDPEPHYDDLVADVARFLLDRARAGRGGRTDARADRARRRARPRKDAAQSAVLLRESGVHAALGYPFLLSASNKRFLGELLDRPRSTTGAPSRSRPSPTASGADAGSCACTTSSDPRGCVACWKRCSPTPQRTRERAPRAGRRSRAARPRGPAPRRRVARRRRPLARARRPHDRGAGAARRPTTTPSERRDGDGSRSSCRRSPRSSTRCRARRS